MPITAFTIENFKSIREPVRVELKPITLLFGPNSAGKSTIVQALHYAREVFERQNINPDRTLLGGDAIDLGGFESLVHQHDLTLPVTLRFDIDLANEDLPSHDESRYIKGIDVFEQTSFELSEVPTRITALHVEIIIRWSEQLAKPYIEHYQVHANSEYLFTIQASSDQKSFRFDINPFNPIFFLDDVTPEKAKEVLSLLNEGEDEDQGFYMGALYRARYELAEYFDESNLYSFDISGGLKSALPKKNATIFFNFPERAFPTKYSPDNPEQMIINAKKDAFTILKQNLGMLLGTLITGPCDVIRDALNKFCYVGPLRNVPTRGHKPVSSPDASRWSNGLAAYDTLFFSDESFIDRVNNWLLNEERLNSSYSVAIKKYRELENDHPLMLAMLQGRILDEEMNLREELLALPVMRRLVIRDENRDIELAPQDIGVGISQVLPVVVAALKNKTGIVAIEQPELHIHPAFQVALGDLFIEQIRQHPDLNFILETHSEHLMLRFLRRIRETDENEAPKNRNLIPAELSIYFIEQGETGISCFPIRVDDEGDFIDRWPKGFFNERAEELFS